MATGPRTEVVGFSIPSRVEQTPTGESETQWSALAEVMNAWLGTAPARRIWIRDVIVDRAHNSSKGKGALHAYILYESAWLPFEETRIGSIYETRFFDGSLDSAGYDSYEEWFADTIDAERNRFLPKHIIPVPSVLPSEYPGGNRYFVLGFNLRAAQEVGQRRFDTTCLIGIPIEDIAANGDFGRADLYDSSGKFVWQPNSIVNVGPTILEKGEICFVIPDQEEGDYIAVSMCCRAP